MTTFSTFFPKTSTLTCKGKLLDLSSPKVMGILNVTPDSFYDAGRYNDEKSILAQVEKMLTEGAAIIDIGGMSSRPGAKIIAIEEELQRVIPAIETVHKHFPSAIISIDTIHSKVAKYAIEAGAAMINDISAGSIDEELMASVAQLKVPYVLMHLQGQRENMQTQVQYNDLIQDIIAYFERKIAQLQQHGVHDILLDIGFGFGKTQNHNYQLLKQLKDFQIFGLPILCGISRKSMIYNLLEIDAANALNGSTVAHTIALLNGCQLLRVHDVKEAVEAIRITETIREVK